ncbi:ABC transporter permease [uncultured Prevotella sp.]|jgi:putative ABC transporter, permease protein|uniref:ABC transporter permease n=1 Tax=uncultured Prevotella sp. TaxID=159272 RepID=UPI00266FC0D6|nr:ABC transporter permease [uncultured Prevotella sp.]
MKQFKSFIIKEARHILRDKRTMLILFGMPVVMMLLFGFAISTDVRNVRTAVVLSHVNHQTHKMVERLGANEYFDILYKVDNSAAAEQLIRHQKADMAIVFDRNNAIQVITDGADPNMAQMYANYATMILQSSDTSVMTQKLLFNPQMRSCYNFVPGIMGMLLMLICAMMTSISIVREKERGTMEVLLVSPIRPLMIIIAKAVPYLLLAFVILCTILLISKYLLLVPISGSLFWIFLVSCIYIIVALSLGLLISTVAKTQLVALLASAMMLLLPCILLSGMMFPVESMLDILQYISAIMPPRYYISAMRKLMIMGVGIDKVMHELMVLSLMAVVLLSAALLKFRSRLE